MLNVIPKLQATDFTISATPADMLGYAADVANDLVPLALAFAGVMMGMRIFRAMKR